LISKVRDVIEEPIVEIEVTVKMPGAPKEVKKPDYFRKMTIEIFCGIDNRK